MDKEQIRIFQNTRVRLVQEEYALLMGQADYKYINGKIDKHRYQKVREILLQYREYIDNLINKHSPKRGIDLLPKPVLAILRVIIAETFIGKFVPPKVGINEAVELAKKFGTARSYSFVNGLLASIIKNEFPDLYKEVLKNTNAEEKANKDKLGSP